MDIPRYPDSRPLALEDKPLLDRLLWELQPRISELAFANLYLFRLVHDYRLCWFSDALVVLGKGWDGHPYFLPPLCGDVAGACRELLAIGRTLYGADDRFLERHFPELDQLELTEDRDNFDYLHVREEMAELAGKNYHKKKNRVNYFMLRHRFQVELYEERHLEGALAVLEEWQRVRQAMGPSSLDGEVGGAAEGFRLYRELGLSGVVVLVDGVVKGVALGERLSESTAVIHFEKADLFFEGLYQLLDREFCRLLFTECQYVNREQDLGELSLRQAKLSYHPVELLRKYRVRLKGGE
jgi:uncharacterized protein